MTFLDKYRQETTWHGRALVMEIYHLAMSQRETRWTVTKTAQYFQVSVGLASENLRLAHAIHEDAAIVQLKHRQDALKRLPDNAERTGT
jgi:hypothetical protein